MVEDTRIPLLEHEPSETPVFTAAILLKAARIRKGLPKVAAPAGCLLDFDGELVQHLAGAGKAAEDTAWHGRFADDRNTETRVKEEILQGKRMKVI